MANGKLGCNNYQPQDMIIKFIFQGRLWIFYTVRWLNVSTFRRNVGPFNHCTEYKSKIRRSFAQPQPRKLKNLHLVTVTLSAEWRNRGYKKPQLISWCMTSRLRIRRSVNVLKPSGIYTFRLQKQNLLIFPTQCTYIFLAIVTIDSDYLCKHH